MTPVSANRITPPLAAPVTTLWGVGAERARQLERLNIFTVEDLLLHRPRRYEDRRHFRPIAELQLEESATTRGTVVAAGTKRYRQGTKSIFELILDDGTARLHCRWWNLPFMEKYFQVGDEVVVYGRPQSLKPRTIDHPETEVIESGEENFIHFNRITPVYPLTEGLPQRWLRALIWRALEKFESKIPEREKVSGVRYQVSGKGSAASSSPDTSHFAPDTSVSPDTSHLAPDTSFPSRANAIHMLHFPEAQEDVELARRRLALDEFVALQRQILARRKNFEVKAQAFPCGGDNRMIRPFLARLGFTLTDAQTRVLREIRADLRGAHPMRRLLQGDVGSGKTVVAACTALMALESGYNVALMAPTEILAEQHFRNFRGWFEPLGIGVELRTGSHRPGRFEVRSERGEPAVRSHLSPLTSHLTIGTHALLTAGFELPRLGLAIIDEQHKFGVAQREQLVRKGRYPHLLVMTATPIPRTLGLTLYGELDISTIDALPPGRGRVKTFVRTTATLPKVWSFVREKLGEGRQAYVVYPRVEETGGKELKAVTKEFDTIKRSLAPFRVGLLHGRLRSKEKEEVMTAFRTNAAQVLLATSLIEVGVDVPNATVMLIENAEQFGLAQLHQLRGRIGRGTRDSFCILVASAKNEDAQRRLKVLEETTDGFRIAEADLQLRGPGELLGREQSGAPNFRFGNLATDQELIQLARQVASREGG
jgi:ATP-dependent DNA helicase RecG